MDSFTNHMYLFNRTMLSVEYWRTTLTRFTPDDFASMTPALRSWHLTAILRNAAIQGFDE